MTFLIFNPILFRQYVSLEVCVSVCVWGGVFPSFFFLFYPYKCIGLTLKMNIIFSQIFNGLSRV